MAQHRVGVEDPSQSGSILMRLTVQQQGKIQKKKKQASVLWQKSHATRRCLTGT